MKLQLFLFLVITNITAFTGSASTHEVFRDDVKKVVKIDTLIWQDSSSISSNQLNWDEANNYCTNLEFAGFKDWKLPSVEMLLVLNKDKSALKKFQNIHTSSLWAGNRNPNSSTVNAISFKDNLQHLHHASEKNQVLCVTNDSQNLLVDPEDRNISVLDNRFGYTINAKQLNIRDQPSLDSNVVGKYNSEDRIKITTQKGKWVQTDKGWISSRFLVKKIDLMNLMESISTLLMTYSVIIALLLLFSFIYGFTGFIIGSIILNIIGYYFFYFEYSLIHFSFIYLMLLMIVFIQIFLFIFKKDYPRRIKNINSLDIQLSKEDLYSMHTAMQQIIDLKNERSTILNSDITRNKDGSFRQSEEGKKADADLKKIKSSIKTQKNIIKKSKYAQSLYIDKWGNTNIIRSVSDAFILSIILSIVLILGFNYYLTSNGFETVNIFQYIGLPSIILSPFIILFISNSMGTSIDLELHINQINDDAINKLG